MPLTDKKRDAVIAAFTKIVSSLAKWKVISKDEMGTMTRLFEQSGILDADLSQHSPTIASVAAITILKHAGKDIDVGSGKYFPVSSTTIEASMDAVSSVMKLPGKERETNGSLQEALNELNELFPDDPPSGARPEPAIRDSLLDLFREEAERKADLVHAIIEKHVSRQPEPDERHVDPLIDKVMERLEIMESGIEAKLDIVKRKIDLTVKEEITGTPERDMHLVFVDLNNVVAYAQGAGLYFSMDWLFDKIDESLRYIDKDYNVKKVHGFIYCIENMIHYRNNHCEALRTKESFKHVDLMDRFEWFPIGGVFKIQQHDKKQKPQDIDTYLVARAVEELIVNDGKVKTFHLACGDSDMIPVIECAVARSVYACVIAYQKNLSHKLRDRANHYTLLDVR